MREQDQLLLSHWNLSYWPDLHLLKCDLCEKGRSGIIVNDIKGHMMRVHGVKMPKKDDDKIFDRSVNPESIYLRANGLVLPALPFDQILMGLDAACVHFTQNRNECLRSIFQRGMRGRVPNSLVQLVGAPPISR